jgi:septum formation protein
MGLIRSRFMKKRAEMETDYTISPEARQTAATAGLILASGSPRRKNLLEAAGLRFTVRKARVPERRRPGERAEPMARRLATAKARAVATSRRRGLVLGADTVVVLDDRPLGKPPSPRAARKMLRLLSGRTHRVVTALALVDAKTTSIITGTCRSSVRFRRLTSGEINRYVASGEPMDKAGSYAIQGTGSDFVDRVWGSHSNVVGLPIPLLSRLLEEAGRSAGRVGRPARHRDPARSNWRVPSRRKSTR